MEKNYVEILKYEVNEFIKSYSNGNTIKNIDLLSKENLELLLDIFKNIEDNKVDMEQWEIDDLVGERDQLESDIEEKNEEILDLEDKINDLEDKINDLEDKIEELEK